MRLWHRFPQSIFKPRNFLQLVYKKLKSLKFYPGGRRCHATPAWINNWFIQQLKPPVKLNEPFKLNVLFNKTLVCCPTSSEGEGRSEQNKMRLQALFTIYSRFHKTLSKSDLWMHWTSARFYAMGVIKSTCIYVCTTRRIQDRWRGHSLY